MNNRQENKLSMYFAVDATLQNHDAAVQSVPILATSVAEFRNLVTLIQQLGRKQGEDLTGIAEDKQRLSSLMAERAIVVASKVSAFAALSNNADLAARVDTAPSDFTRGRDSEIDDIAERILESAETHREALLTDYGLTEDQINALSEAIDAYRDILAKPRTARVARKAITEQLAAEFTRIDDLLSGRIDPLIFSLKPTHPEAVAEYQNARIIVDTGSRRTEPAEPTL